MRMHNPPSGSRSPGISRRPGRNQVGASSADHARDALSPSQRQGRNLRPRWPSGQPAALGTTPELWMNMQSQYDLWRARQTRQPVVRRFAHAEETAADFFKKRAGKATGAGLMKFLRTAPKASMSKYRVRALGICAENPFRPCGTRFHLWGLTQDLRPGLSYAAPTGLEFAGPICAFAPDSVSCGYS
jgi:hypothetical protein